MHLPRIAALLLAPVAAAPACAQTAEQALLMAPTSAWSVDYAEDSCALRRTFGSGEDTAVLELRQVGPGESYEFTIGSDTLSRSRGTLRIRYGSDEDWFEPSAPFWLIAGSWEGVRFSDSLRPIALKSPSEPPPAWPEAERDAREAAVVEFQLTGSFERELTLKVGRMHPPMEAMRTCTRELVTRWGLDAQVQDTLSRRPTPIRQVDWARRTMDAYPRDMIRQNKSGRVPIRLLVGADGKPTNCVAAKGFADPAFETAACSGSMRYARFEPALDASGQPVASYFITTIIYQLGR